MFVNVPVALAVFVLTPLAVPESRESGTPRTLDVPGAAAATLGFASLIYAVSEVPQNGWTSPTTLGFGTAGVLLLAAFVATENRSSAPLVPPVVFRERAVVVPNAAIALQSMVGVAWLYVLTLYFQEVLGHGPLAAGLLFAPMTAVSVVAAPVAGRLATSLGVRPTATAGLALLGAGLLLMTRMSGGGGLIPVLCGTVVGEFGFMLSNVPLTIAASGSTGERGLASGLLNTSIQLGNTLGLAAVATVAAVGGSLVGGLRSGLLLCVGIVALALPTVLFGLHGAGE
jgi:predicted MFS family arabinose efflux permease